MNVKWLFLLLYLIALRTLTFISLVIVPVGNFSKDNHLPFGLSKDMFQYKLQDNISRGVIERVLGVVE